MGKKYKSSPIIEAVCEFRLSQDSKWDLTVPGLIYEKVRKDFPEKKQKSLMPGIEISTSEKGIDKKIMQFERIQFLSEDEKRLIQIDDRLLTINCLKPYPSWNEFKPMIEKIYNSMLEVVDAKGFERLGLRYINRIETPRQPINLDDHFEFRPFLGQNLPQDLADFFLNCIFPFSEGKDLCKVGLKSALPEEENKYSFILDIDYFLAQPNEVTIEDAMLWVEKAHDEVEKIFEGCISDKLREQFEEDN